MDRIEKTLERTEAKSLEERALTRLPTPCIFLAKERCSVYPVRPFVCQALHSLNGDACRKALESNSRLVEIEGYAHRYDIFMTVKAGVEQVCKDRGCQVDTLLMARAMKRCLEDPSLGQAWMKGRGAVPAGFVPA